MVHVVILKVFLYFIILLRIPNCDYEFNWTVYFGHFQIVLVDNTFKLHYHSLSLLKMLVKLCKTTVTHFEIDKELCFKIISGSS